MDARFFAPGSIVEVPAWRAADGALGVAVEPVPGGKEPLHDPPLEPRDEVVFLLTAAAEIEHALMAQYLFAAYSVRVVAGEADHDALEAVQGILTQIAREEMGHLATVQNLLHLVGGPLNLNREHSPYASTIYPFRFALEPLTRGSLAKYVTAESPAVLPSTVSEADKELLLQIRAEATAANGGEVVRHVGPIFERLVQLFGDREHGLADADIRLDTFARQATFPDWGIEARSAPEGETLIVDSFPDTDVDTVRDAAVEAVRRIGAQGEGFDPGPIDSESHFERFFDTYKSVRTLTEAGVDVTWPVATNPNTTRAPASGEPPAADEVRAALEAQAAVGRITEPRARGWAQLFDLRYRLLLGLFAHFLRLDGDLYSTASGPQLGDRTARGLLLIWTFDEMRRLSKIARKLVQLPKDSAPDARHAGPPFELPYTLNLPDGEPQRWRTHLDVLRAARRLVEERLQPPTAADRDEFLDDLLRRDAAARTAMGSLAAGAGVPPESLPTGFAKAVQILEEAVRGFTIGRHGNFWAGRTRDEFLAGSPRPVNLGPEGTVDPDPGAAPLVRRLEGTAPGNPMPRFRPRVPATRIGFIRQWIQAGCPDDSPPGEIGVAHERDPRPETQP